MKRRDLLTVAALAGLPLLAAATPPKPAAKPGPTPPPAYDQDTERRQAATRSLALLQKSTGTFSQRSGPQCVSCHHALLPVMTLALARERGLPVDEARAKAERKRVDGLLAAMGPVAARAQTDPAADKGLESGDMPFMFAYLLSGFAAERRAPDASTRTLARYLLRKQLADGRWPAYGTRAPLEGNAVTVTALAVRALLTYAPESERAPAVERARGWLAATAPRTNEERAFRLLGLKWAGADPESVRRAADELIATQNDDGGWPQLPYRLLSSDAYATGQALYALHEGGGLATGDAIYQRGLNFLVYSQRPDGAWIVAKRCHPVVPYFDGGFPGGKDQYISFAGSCWADMAIALALPPRTARR